MGEGTTLADLIKRPGSCLRESRPIHRLSIRGLSGSIKEDGKDHKEHKTKYIMPGKTTMIPLPKPQATNSYGVHSRAVRFQVQLYFINREEDLCFLDFPNWRITRAAGAINTRRLDQYSVLRLSPVS